MGDVEYRRLIPIGEWIDRARPSNRSLSDDDREAVIREVFFESAERSAYLWRFGVLMVLSTALAALGLIANSVAVIIGAMLVAPLMTPMLGTAASLVLADAKHLLRSLATLIAGTASAIATGYIVALVAPGGQSAERLSSEIIARANPNLLDLAVAVVAGLAGGYVLTHPRASSSLPGVAIAVALVPPLATVGVTLALGSNAEAVGALLLFLTNFLAIVLSALIVMVVTGFTPEDVRMRRGSQAWIGIAVTLSALLLISVPLTVYTQSVIADQRFTTRVVDAIGRWDPAVAILELEADISDTHASIELVVAAPRSPAPAWQLATMLSDETGRIVDVDLRAVLEEQETATSG